MNTKFFISFLLLTYILKAQELNYEITSADLKLGNLTVTKTQNKDTLLINIMSIVNVDLLIKSKVKYKADCIYHNDELLYSKVIVSENGKIHSINETENLGKYYLLTNNKKKSKYFNKICYSSALLYIKEPINISTIFSETNNQINPVINIGINAYQITNSKNGHKNEYYYENGILQKAVIHHTLFNFNIIRVNEKK